MSNDEGAHLAKARRMLAQADGLSVEDAPESVILRGPSWRSANRQLPKTNAD